MKLAAILLLAVFPSVVFAQVSISEIFYDAEGSDSKHEWIEIYNDGSSAIDLSAWKFYEAETNHKLSWFSGDTSLASGDYGVIAENPETFLLDNPTYSGLLFDSSFSLSNTGESLALIEPGGGTSDSVSYSSEWGAAGDGNSLQIISGQWLVGAPSPGYLGSAATQVEAEAEQAEESSSESEETTSQHISYSQSNQNPNQNQSISIQLIEATKNGVAGAPMRFEAESYGLLGKKMAGAHYTWNFGDGGVASAKSVSHIYHYPGSYNLAAIVASGEYTASARMQVTIMEPDIVISDIDAESGDYVALKNNMSSTIDISGWLLQAQRSTFVFPKGTQLAKGQEVKFALAITGITVDSNSTVSLMFPNGTIVSSGNRTMSQTKDSSEESVEIATTVAAPSTERKVESKQVKHPTPTPYSTVKATGAKKEAALKSPEVPATKYPHQFKSQQLASALLASDTASGKTPLWLWLLAVAGIVSLGSLGYIFTARSESEVPSTKYVIVEEE